MPYTIFRVTFRDNAYGFGVELTNEAIRELDHVWSSTSAGVCLYATVKLSSFKSV